MPTLSKKHAKTSSYGELCKSKPNKANFVYQKYCSRSLLDHRLFFNQYKRASMDTNMTAMTKAKRTLRLIPPSVYLVFNRHLRVVKPGERVRSTIVFFFLQRKTVKFQLKTVISLWPRNQKTFSDFFCGTICHYIQFKRFISRNIGLSVPFARKAGGIADKNAKLFWGIWVRENAQIR